MLKFLRRKGVMKKVLWFVAIVIIISFGVLGTASRLNQKTSKISYAGKIFHRKVSFNEYENALIHSRNQAVLRYGENFYKIQQYVDLDAETWDRLILMDEAKKRKIRVPDQEVINAVRDFNFFKPDGQFSQELYSRLLRYLFQCTPRDFEEGVRESLTFAKLYEQETFLVDVTDEELKEAYRKENEKVQISYALFANEEFTKDIIVTPQQAQEFYDQHKNAFQRPLTVNVEYLYLALAENASEEQKKEVTAKADQLSTDLKNSSNLQDIAKKYNAEVKESGFFSREEPLLSLGWPYELLQKIFTMDVNDVSPLVKTSTGYYALKLKEKKEANLPAFEEIVSQVQELLRIEEAKKIAQKKANEYLEKIRAAAQAEPSKEFSVLTKELSLSLLQTPLFNRGQYLPGLGIAKDFQDAAFALNDKNKISDVVETPKGYAILHLDTSTPIDQEKFNKGKDSFRTTLLELKKSDAFTQFIAKLRVKAQIENHIKKMKEETEEAAEQDIPVEVEQ